MNRNQNLEAAKVIKNDEFYTRLSDIENELQHYTHHFKGKVVLCNCDDPFASNFFKYFVLNYRNLELKALICTCYADYQEGGTEQQQNTDIDDINCRCKKHGYKAVVSNVQHIKGKNDIERKDIAELLQSEGNSLTEFNGDGDFMSNECLELLNEADIICTNPPFSKFRQFVSMLMSHNKKFLIIGNMNAIGYRDFFPLLKRNEIWMGYNHVKEFLTPDGTVQKFGNIRWYTNLDIPLHHENMNFKCKYDPQHYSRFENYNAINVDRLSEIPYDYTGTMGVPISYMERYNPELLPICEANFNWQ